MPETFGARLRQHREGQGILLITIAEQTKIKMSLLEAVERDDVSQWPSGIFRRAFIRAYAHAIGLDPDIVVREFLETHPEPAEVAAAASAAAAAADNARPNTGPPTRLRSLVGSALGSLSLRRRSAPVEDSPAPAPAPAAVPRAADPGAAAIAPPPRRPDRDPGPQNQDVSIEVAGRNVPAATVPATVPPPADHRSAAIAPALPPPDPGPAAHTRDAPILDIPMEVAPQSVPAAFEPDLIAVANVCTEFGRVRTTADVQSLVEESANILEAIGLIVWIWDGTAAELRPALVHGYSERVLAQLPPVRRDDDNATAAAFRLATARVIEGSDHTSGALVIPLLTSAGCAGVLALEFPNGRQSMQPVQAVATIIAALLAPLFGDRAEEAPEADRVASPIDTFAVSPLQLTPAAR